MAGHDRQMLEYILNSSHRDCVSRGGEGDDDDEDGGDDDDEVEDEEGDDDDDAREWVC